MLFVIQFIHVVVCITLILFILLQSGKGADLGAMFGGGGSNTLFGATGAATFLSKLTTYAAIIFVFTCLIQAYISAHPSIALQDGGTVIPAELPAEEPVNTPEQPATGEEKAAVPETTGQAETAPVADTAAVPEAAPAGTEPAAPVAIETGKAAAAAPAEKGENQ